MSRFRTAANAMTLSEHLVEARRRFLIIIVVLGLMSTASFFLYPQLLHILQSPYCHASPQHCQFLATSPLDGLSIRCKLSLYCGLLFTLPVALWEAWRFVTPGLKSAERKYALPFIAATIVFFLLGVVVAYFTFDHALAWLASIGGSHIETLYNPNQYLTLFILMMVIFGITFEFPVILVALELAGLVTPKRLLSYWRIAVIGIFVIAAVFTPSGDPFSMLVLAIPLVAFYFLAIGIGKLLKK